MNILQFLNSSLSERSDFCCLCFHQNVKQINMSDRIFLDNNITYRLYEIITMVLREDILQNIVGHHICEECANSAISSFKFYQTCKHNLEMFTKMINNLSTNLNSTPDNLNSNKSMFVHIKTNNCESELFYDKSIITSKRAAIQKFETLQKQSMYTQSRFIDEETPRSTTHRRRLRRGGKVNYKCTICSKDFHLKFNYWDHIYRMHTPKIYKCTKCPRRFGHERILEKHNQTSHCTVFCSECGKSYNNIFSLLKHEKSHRDLIRHSCTLCGKDYKHKKSLETHVCGPRKLGIRNFICDYCGKPYSHRSAITAHIRFNHELTESTKVYSCPWCSKKFPNIGHLNSHTVTHTQDKKFPCSVCGGKFSSSGSLKKHIRIHNDEKPFACEYCGRMFRTVDRRNDHSLRNHTFKMVECDVCNATFKETSLKKHRKLHFDVNSRLYMGYQNEQ